LDSKGEVIAHLNGKAPLEQPKQPTLGKDSAPGPKEKSPPIFNSFYDWARWRASSSQAQPPPNPIVIPWPSTLFTGPSVLVTHSPVTDLCLGRVPI
jgi:hypothetical protein